MFSDTFAGIAPSSVPPFIAAQVLGGILAAGVIGALYPAITPAEAADIIVPHHEHAGRAPARAAHDGASPSADRPSGPVQPR
jgi:glycerol uptake facilitator-like aquaporin